MKPYLLIVSILLLSVSSIQAQEKPRIITLSPHLAEIVFALGSGKHIIATVEHTDYPEAAREIRTIGNSNSINIETIIGLKPDVILAWRTGNPELQLKRLDDLGVNIYYSKPESIDDLISEITQIGQLIGKEQQARDLANKIRTKVDQTKQRYSTRKPVAVFYQIWHQPLRSVGNDPWIAHLLKYCGAKNIFEQLTQAFPLVSYEAVLAKNPQIIIVPTKGKTTEETNRWRSWPTIRAVKNNFIETLNPDTLHRFTPRITDGLQALCESIEKVRKLNAN